MDIDKPVGNNRIHTKQTAMAIYIAKTYPPIQLIFQLKLVSKKNGVILSHSKSLFLERAIPRTRNIIEIVSLLCIVSECPG